MDYWVAGVPIAIAIIVALGVAVMPPGAESVPSGDLADSKRWMEVRVTGVEFQEDATNVGLEIAHTGGVGRADFDWEEAVIIRDGRQYLATGAAGIDPVLYPGATTAGEIVFPAMEEGEFVLNVGLVFRNYESPLSIFTFEVGPGEIGNG